MDHLVDARRCAATPPPCPLAPCAPNAPGARPPARRDSAASVTISPPRFMARAPASARSGENIISIAARRSPVAALRLAAGGVAVAIFVLDAVDLRRPRSPTAVERLPPHAHRRFEHFARRAGQSRARRAASASADRTRAPAPPPAGTPRRIGSSSSRRQRVAVDAEHDRARLRRARLPQQIERAVPSP